MNTRTSGLNSGPGFISCWQLTYAAQGLPFLSCSLTFGSRQSVWLVVDRKVIMEFDVIEIICYTMHEWNKALVHRPIFYLPFCNWPHFVSRLPWQLFPSELLKHAECDVSCSSLSILTAFRSKSIEISFQIENVRTTVHCIIFYFLSLKIRHWARHFISISPYQTRMLKRG
jgi:hypothetical protein